MAIDDYLSIKTPLSATSTSSSNSERRRRLIQIATENSSSFIPFPRSSRRSSVFIPISQLRKRPSSISPLTVTTDTQSISNKSKSSNTPSSTTRSDEQKRSRRQHGFNPILNNPLLNHRKQPSIEHLPHLMRLSPSKFDRTSPTILPPTEYPSKKPHLPNETKHHEVPYVNTRKHDYITRWLQEVRLAVCSADTLSKKRLVQS